MRLFESARIGKLRVKNRIVMAPMHIGGLVEPDGRLSQQGIDYYVARAKGGTGLIIAACACVSRKLEQLPDMPYSAALMVDSNIYVARLTQLAEAIHDYGAKVAIQLTAGLGRVAPKAFLKKGGFVAPSPLPSFFDPNIVGRELMIEEIEQLVQAFRFGAEILKLAGIDAVELHGHEGYLFDQFKTDLWNKRTDKYGRDLGKRLRFSLEVVEAIKRGAGDDFPVIYRFGLTHYMAGGREIEEGLEIARRLEGAGVDALDVDAGCYETWHWPHPPTTQPMGCMVDLAEMAKTVVKIPVMAVGKLGAPELAERVLQERKADFIMLGRPLLADPEWPNKVRENNWEDICPCIGDHECLKREAQGKYICCTVNPTTGMERVLVVRLAERKKSVLVVGGGPAGMEAARIAALRGHRVTLWEKKDALGGNLIPGSVPGFKQEYRSLVNYLINQIKKLGVTIELEKEATPKLVKKMKADVVFIATGGTPIIPKISGVEKQHVVTAIDLLLGKKVPGETVVVLGGGIVGCETSLYLAQQGKKLTIVEILDNVMRDIYLANRLHLLELLADLNVKIMTETTPIEITDNAVVIRDKNSKTGLLMADTVVLALGLKPNEELLEGLSSEVSEVFPIGDCVEPRRVINAIWEGFRTARLI